MMSTVHQAALLTLASHVAGAGKRLTVREWGYGESSESMRRALIADGITVRWVSVETSARWALNGGECEVRYLCTAAPDDDDDEHQQAVGRSCPLPYVAAAIDYPRVRPDEPTLWIVDGRHRSHCLRAALEWCRSSTAACGIALHDAAREWYRNAVEDVREFSRECHGVLDGEDLLFLARVK